ncbi:MAG: sialidase family protein [Candidatus Ventricola sp.]|nr:sialidase family protein [Candidatus Ventricola sp.]
MHLKHLFDLPPSPGNPRNSEGAFLALRDGRILFVYSHFSGSVQDDAAAELWALTLDGDTASPPAPLIPAPDDGAQNLMSVSLLRMANGDIGLFYLRRHGQTSLEMVLRRSGDEGKTWSSPTPVTARAGYFVVNNDRVCRLTGGSILVPAAEHKKFLRADGSVYFDPRAEAVFFRSDDDGQSFYELPGKGVMPYADACGSGLQEPGVLELRDGRLWSWARTDLGSQWEMFSFTGGQSWTPPAPSRFTSPLSPMCVRRLADGTLLALYNPVPLYNGRSAYARGVWTGGRTPLALRLSQDDGQTWNDPVLLESDPFRGYCYTAIFEEAPGRLLLAYCAGGPEDGVCLARLRLARLFLGEDAAQA